LTRINKKPLTALAIIASLAALVIIIVPSFSLPPALTNNGNNPNSSQDEEEIEEEIPDVSDEDLETCNSWHPAVLGILGSDPDGGLATDLVIGEFCNRPDLIKEIRASDQPGPSVIAYSCEAVSGQINDSRLADKVQIYGDLYCSAAMKALVSEGAELHSLANGIEGILVAQQPPPSFDVPSTIANIHLTITESESMIEKTPYQAQLGFNEASVKLKELVIQASPSSVNDE
jgi:hypothetical protein